MRPQPLEPSVELPLGNEKCEGYAEIWRVRVRPQPLEPSVHSVEHSMGHETFGRCAEMAVRM